MRSKFKVSFKSKEQFGDPDSTMDTVSTTSEESAGEPSAVCCVVLCCTVHLVPYCAFHTALLWVQHMHDMQKPKHPYLQQSEVPRQCFSNSICALAEPSHDSTWLDQDTSDASRSMKGHRGDYRCIAFCPHLSCSIWYIRTICTVPYNRACSALPACDLTSKTWPITHLKGCVEYHLPAETLH